MTPTHSRSLADREEELCGAEVAVTKLDAAKSQLNTAIDLFFSDGDPVSQLTLIAAAHGVLRDVALSKGVKKSFKDSPLISEHERSAYLKVVHGPQNFFKHAKDDPTGKMLFRYKITPLYLLDAVVLLVELGEEITWSTKVFLMWIQLEFPELLCDPAAEEFLQKIRTTSSSSEEFRLLGVHLLKNEIA